MKNVMNCSLMIIMLVSHSVIRTQEPEEQFSFAQIPKPHSYYVEQAELWWQEIEKNQNDENIAQTTSDKTRPRGTHIIAGAVRQCQ